MKSSLVIGIGGGTGAGKTAIAEELAAAVGGVTVITLDNYYEPQPELSAAERARRNYDHPDAFEWALLLEQLDALSAGQAIEMPQYDFERHARAPESRLVEPSEVLVVEGILTLYDPRVRDRLDLSVYVQTDADVRILRRIRRDVVDRGRDLEDVIDRYLRTVKPMHERFVAPTRRHADVIIPEGVNRGAVGLLVQTVAAETDRKELAGLDLDLDFDREHDAGRAPSPLEHLTPETASSSDPESASGSEAEAESRPRKRADERDSEGNEIVPGHDADRDR